MVGRGADTDLALAGRIRSGRPGQQARTTPLRSTAARGGFRKRGLGRSAGWCCWVLGLREPVDEHVDASGESLVPVVEPDVLAEGDQGGEAVTGQ